MREHARSIVDAALRKSPLQPYFARRSGAELAVLAYHGVDDPERFAEHVDFIARWMNPISLNDFISSRSQARPLPPRSVLITFDDGHASVAEYAAPLLWEHGLPAVVFVVTALIDTDHVPWWEEVEHLLQHGAQASALTDHRSAEAIRALKRMPNANRIGIISDLRQTSSTLPLRRRQLQSDQLRQLDAIGIEIGSHTDTHPCLDTCDDATIVSEISRSHERLTAAMGKQARSFAYPNGNWDPRAEARLGELGYDVAFTFDHRHVKPDAHPLRVSRLRVNSHTSVDRLAVILSGLHPALHHARGRR